MGETLDRVPAHLRRYVVQQDYDAYTAIDQAVWRFVVLQMFDRLRQSAHPAYARGLSQTGMSVERIPRIADMDACLGRFGWGAVCVDGFIPPRAFQEFQALGILPIAADMRRLENLPYTPAPDIIHEAAGHAPILPDPEYAAFLRHISQCGMRAFASRRDSEMFQAVRQLSIAKEQRELDPHAVGAALDSLAAMAARPEAPSEATRLSRLYWWTVEYGLVGTPRDYKLYGAGLLSSLAESHFCHDARVRKLELSADVVMCDYDITQPQPQLFVARDFAHLSDVLEAACAQCAFRLDGLAGLRIACEAGELASVEFEAGLDVIGTVAQVVAEGDRPALIRLSGQCALADGGTIVRSERSSRRALYPGGMVVAFAPEADADTLCGDSAGGWSARLGAPVRDLALHGGMRAEGHVAEVFLHAAHGLRALVLEHARVWRGGELLCDVGAGVLLLLASNRVRSVRAGASDGGYWPAEPYPDLKVPRSEPEGASERELRALYEREFGTRAEPSPLSALAQMHERLAATHPDEWLLRWYLLARLTELDADPKRRARLVDELWRLELKFERRHPIATGLSYLGYRTAALG